MNLCNSNTNLLLQLFQFDILTHKNKIANKTYGTFCRDSEFKCSNKVMGLLPDDL